MAYLILDLETSQAEVCQEFKKGNFSVQLSKTNTFGRCKSDKVIETTINKNNETSGGLTGCGTKKALVDVGLDRFTEALVSLHVSTGCVTVSVFSGLGKTKAFRKMARNVEYVKIFEKLGMSGI